MSRQEPVHNKAQVEKDSAYKIHNQILDTENRRMHLGFDNLKKREIIISI